MPIVLYLKTGIHRLRPSDCFVVPSCPPYMVLQCSTIFKTFTAALKPNNSWPSVLCYFMVDYNTGSFPSHRLHSVAKRYRHVFKYPFVKRAQVSHVRQTRLSTHLLFVMPQSKRLKSLFDSSLSCVTNNISLMCSAPKEFGLRHLREWNIVFRLLLLSMLFDLICLIIPFLK